LNGKIMITSTPSSNVDDPNWLQILIVSALGSLALLAIIGFVLGINNNLFTLPIVADLYHEPQFSQDVFIQSLRFYSAGPWILLSGAGKYIDAYWLYLALIFLSQLLAFAGFLACADLLGIRTLNERLLLTAFLCATPLLRGHSFAGNGGLFVNHFTHSEIANGLTLLLIYFLVRRKLISALAINGLIFFNNAFIGVWDAGITIAVTLVLLLQHLISWRRVVSDGLVGVVIAGIISAPVIWYVLANPDFGKSVTFDYIAFLEEFWPYHFLFGDIGTVEKLDLLSLVVLGIASFLTLGSKARLFLIATVGFASIYVLGIVAPYFTHSPLVLNLHLLRVGTMLHLLAMLGALSLATEWWNTKDPIFPGFFAPILIILLCTPIKMSSIQPIISTTFASALIASSHYQDVRSKFSSWLFNRRSVLKPVALALVALGLLIVSSRNIIANAHATAWVDEWRALATWTGKNTSPDATILLPTWNFLGRPPRIESESVEDEAVLNAGIFEFVSHRSVWVDFRNGAAVLWAPSYYELWHRRIAEVNALDSHDAKIAYAKNNGIGYIVEACGAKGVAGTIYTTARLCLYSVSPDLAKP
jgi:hypothetical protein